MGKVDYQCNYLQGLEGVTDGSHSAVLHTGYVLMHWTQEQSDAAEEAAAAETAKKQEKELRGGTGSGTGPLIPPPEQEDRDSTSEKE